MKRLLERISAVVEEVALALGARSRAHEAAETAMLVAIHFACS